MTVLVTWSSLGLDIKILPAVSGVETRYQSPRVLEMELEEDKVYTRPGWPSLNASTILLRLSCPASSLCPVFCVITNESETEPGDVWLLLFFTAARIFSSSVVSWNCRPDIRMICAVSDFLWSLLARICCAEDIPAAN